MADISIKQLIVYFWFLIIFLCQVWIQSYLYRIYRENKKMNEKMNIIIEGFKALYQKNK